MLHLCAFKFPPPCSVSWKIFHARYEVSERAIFFSGLLCIGGAALIVHFGAEIESGELWAVVTLIVLAILALYVFSVIVLQPQIKSDVNFKVCNSITFFRYSG